MKTKKINFSGGHLAYVENRSEGTPIVFIHGNNASKESFQKQFLDPRLSSYRLLAFDLPGHGETSTSEDFFTLDGLVSSILVFCERLNLQNPLFVGHSLGGHLAIRACEKIQAKGLVLTQAPPFNAPEDTLKAFLPSDLFALLATPDLTKDQQSKMAALLAEDPSIQGLITSWISHCSPKLRETLSSSMALNSYKEVEVLSHLKIPFFYIGSTHDRVVNLDYVCRVLKDKVIKITSASHLPHLECADLFNVHLLSSIKTIDSQ